jgi:hypothetical protein
LIAGRSDCLNAPKAVAQARRCAALALFCAAADQFLKEYGIVTENQRSPIKAAPLTSTAAPLRKLPLMGGQPLAAGSPTRPASLADIDPFVGQGAAPLGLH